MSSPATISIGRTDTHYVVRVVGKGTWQESCCCQALVEQCLDQSPATIVLDLSLCDYLDSTFLGCLVELRKRYNREQPPRVELIADGNRRAQLFGHSRVDTILQFIDPPPEMPGEWKKVPVAQSSDASRHIMESHKALAELGAPEHATFAKIAQKMEQEMGQRGAEPAATRSS